MRNFKLIFTILACISAGLVHAQETVGQKLTLPAYKDMAANLKSYPLQYDEMVTWGLQGPQTRESVARDLDAIYSKGIRSVTMEAGYRMAQPYLSDGYFESVKMIVEELKKRGMHLWIIDEGKYPSGFAGGKFSQERPDLRMQGLVVYKRVRLKQGEAINQSLDVSVVSAVAVNGATRENELVDISKHNINFTAKADCEVILVQHRFKTSVTRAANNLTGGKDTVNSLCDYLNPSATRQFLEFTHIRYKKYIGDEFGKTVLGFRGDEPEYNFTPWSPGLDSIFKSRKGYDIKPYLATFLTQNTSQKEKLAKADFWDVWSDLYRDNFFKVQADWCAQNGLEYIVHIDHEEMLMDLARTEGDFFKDMRYVQIPGVDAIWHQIWYDNVADYPKLASSAAHLYGHPRAFSESFAAYTPKPTVDDARWVVNEELVRGINIFEFMFWPSSAEGKGGGGSGYMAEAGFPDLTNYANRASYLLANGRPAAQVGLYCPTESMWLGNKEANASLLVLGKTLLEHQIDFDYVDNQSLEDVFKLGKGTFTNMSGQAYKAIIIPTVSILTGPAMARLKAFAQSGGKVIFAGKAPEMVTGKNYLDATPPSAITWATTTELSDAVIKTLPLDVVLDKPSPAIKYLHRTWKDAEFYFFFNEGDQPALVNATLNGTGKAENWDAATAAIGNIANGIAKNGKTTLPLELAAHQTKFIIIHNQK